MLKWAGRIVLALAILLAAGVAAAFFLGPGLIERYLGREMAVGEGRLQVMGPRFRWNLDLAADSLRYESPSLDAGAEGIRVSANLFRSLFRFAPSLDLEVAALDLLVKAAEDSAGADTAEAKGPPSFPDFDIPASLDLRLGRLAAYRAARDSADGSWDTASLGSLAGVTLSNRGKQAARLRIARAESPALGRLAPGLAAEADWEGDRLEAEVSLDLGRPGKASASPAGKGAGDAGASKAPGSPVAPGEARRVPPAGGDPAVSDKTGGGGRRPAGKGAPTLRGADPGAAGGSPAGDVLSLKAGLDKTDLRRGRLELVTRIRSIAEYAFLLGQSPYVTGAGGWDGVLEADFDLAGPPDLELVLTGLFGGLRGDLPVTLGPQDIAVRFGYRDTAGSWSISMEGDRGERAELAGSLAAAARDSLENPAWLARHMAVTLSGGLSGFRVKAAGKDLPARLDIERARYAPGRAAFRVRTGDSTVAEADLAEGKGGWGGTFSLAVAPAEAWLVAFTDTNVAFGGLTASGKVEAGRVRAVTEARNLRAYGLLADSLRAVHRYGGGAYVLETARIERDGAAWTLSGRVDLDKPAKPLSFRLAGADADGGDIGAAELAMPRPTLIEASVRNLAAHRLPYRGLDTLAGYASRLTADFRWDRTAKSGAADLRASARYRGEAVRATAKAAWDARRLDVEGVEAELGGSRARASGAVRLDGRQFYELKGLGLPDLEGVSLEADGFDLAKVLRAVLPEPPLLSGTLQGRLSYSPAEGFRGSYRARDIRPASTADLLAVEEVSLRGEGDTLGIFAVTVSEKEPLLNDTLSLLLSGVLEEVQLLRVDARAGGSLELGFRGSMREFRDIRGALSLAGGIDLPGKSGFLRKVLLKAEIETPFKDALPNLSLRADTLRGEYVVAGVDTQAFSARVRMEGGRLTVPEIVLEGRSGSKVKGRAEYALTGNRALAAHLAGGGLVVQAGTDKVLLREIQVDLRSDSSVLDLRAAVGSGSYEHVKPPLRAAGDFSRVTVHYHSPMGRLPAGAAGSPKPEPARLRMRGMLDSTSLNYRLRSMESLRSVFRRPSGNNGRKGQARASRPLEMDVEVETSGSGHRVETDILRFSFVGNLALRGIMPYALAEGRIAGTGGQLGSRKQAYEFRKLEVKWLNAPLEEGEVAAEAIKRLDQDCDRETTDSCDVITRLEGPLTRIQFAYDSDCGGAFGAGANVAALLYSVQRGCYSDAFSAGGSGLTREEQALMLLEPLASQYLSSAAEKLSGRWIQSAEITGLGALAAGEEARTQDERDMMREAVALEVASREFWRMRVRLRSSYAPGNVEEANPWNYRLGLEWRPPLARFIEDPKWEKRLQDRVVVEAAVFTEPARAADINQGEVRQRLGLNYSYPWWEAWWGKARRDTAAAPASPAPGSEGAAR